jgi:uncharacterized membrane protein
MIGGFFMILFLIFALCIIYPAAMITYYKLIRHSKKAISEILNEI